MAIYSDGSRRIDGTLLGARQRLSLYRCLALLVTSVAAIATSAVPPTTSPATAPASITIHAGEPMCRLSDLMIGANLEDLQYQLTGGLSSQLVHGESFFEPSPTQLAALREPVRGFTTWMGTWTPVDDGELEASVKGEPGMRDSGKAGARITSNRTAAADVVETSVDLRTTEPAGLLVDIGPTDGDGKWDWYTGYTIELDPKAAQVVLRKATRLAGHRELKRQAVSVTPGEWAGLAFHVEGRQLEVKIDGKLVMEYLDNEPLKPARIGVYTTGQTRFKGYRLKTLTGGWWDIPFRANDLLATPGDAISLRWEKVQNGSAEGTFSLDPTNAWHAGKPSQTITFTGGEGEIGIDNAGLQRSGINLVQGKPYEGFARVKAATATEMYVSFRSADGLKTYATEGVTIKAGVDGYQRLPFTLTPTGTDPQGRFAITLRKPGTVSLGYVFLEPGAWGRYKGLPIRKDLAEALVGQGIRVLRFNGGMIERPGYRWKNMQGPRDQRPPYDGFYDRWCSNGFGVIECLQFCEAAGITAFTGLNADETPEAVADFIEYANGSAATTGGQHRAADDDHATPYGLKYYQVGNESEITPAYVKRFKAVAEAVWKVDPRITLVPSGSVQCAKGNETEAEMAVRFAPHVEITRFVHAHGKKLLWDCHAILSSDDPAEPAATDGSIKGAAEFSRWMSKLAPECGVVPVGLMELNAGRFDYQRGLSHALEMNILQRDGERVRAVAMTNVSQPWGISQTDWKAVELTQGSIHYRPGQVWYQPAAYVDQMIARNWASTVVKADVTAPAKTLDVTARRSEDGKQLVLQVVNLSEAPVTADLSIDGFTAVNPRAHVEELACKDLTAFNSLEQPEKIKPAIGMWAHELKAGRPRRTFAAQSFTVIRIE